MASRYISGNVFEVGFTNSRPWSSNPISSTSSLTIRAKLSYRESYEDSAKYTTFALRPASPTNNGAMNEMKNRGISDRQKPSKSELPFMPDEKKKKPLLQIAKANANAKIMAARIEIVRPNIRSPNNSAKVASAAGTADRAESVLTVANPATAKTMFGFEGPCPCPPNETINSKSLSVENNFNNSGTANTAHTARKNALDEFMCHRYP